MFTDIPEDCTAPIFRIVLTPVNIYQATQYHIPEDSQSWKPQVSQGYVAFFKISYLGHKLHLFENEVFLMYLNMYNEHDKTCIKYFDPPVAFTDYCLNVCNICMCYIL